jgi:putative ABC transport system permease protein
VERHARRAPTNRTGSGLPTGHLWVFPGDGHALARRALDESLAHQLDPNGDVLGRTIAFPLDGQAVRAEIVGVVASVRHASLRDPGRPTIYVPYRQEASRDVSVVLRTTGDPSRMTQIGRDAVGRLDPQLPVYDYQPLSAYIGRAMERERLALLVVGGFAGLAGLMAVLGLYATVAYLVRRRVREFGVRVALGATGIRIVGGVVGEGMTQVGVGLLLGAAVAFVTSGPVRPLLYETSLLDPSTWLLAAAALSCASIVACYLPARLAAGVEPVEALRSE